MEKTLHEAKMDMLASQKEFLNELRSDIGAIAHNLGRNKNKIALISFLYNFDYSAFRENLSSFEKDVDIYEKVFDEESLSLEEEIILECTNGNQFDEQRACEILSEKYNEGTIILSSYMARNKISSVDELAPNSIREIIKK